MILLAPAALPAQSLRQQADRLGVMVGGAANPDKFAEAAYAAAFARELNMIEPENVMKFDTIHPARNTYDFSGGDRIVAFGKSNGMAVRGHTLVWHNRVPSWVTSGNFSSSELSAILHDHILAVMQHYAGQVFAWDVVNEAFSDTPPALSSSIWYDAPGIGFNGQGTKYIEQAFRWAHEADPNALLFYNDYGGEVVNPKSNAIYAMAADFKSRGVPLDGIGLQMHLSLTSDLTRLGENIQRLSALGLQVHITEMDVSVPVDASGSPIDPNALQKEAAIYQTVASTCLHYKGCSAIQTWGLTDKYSWIPGFSAGKNGLGLPLDLNYQPKPAYLALLTAFKGAALSMPALTAGFAAISASGGSVMLAAGGLVSVFGRGLASGTGEATSQPLPTALAGTSVQVTDGSGTTVLAPLLFVSPGQINCLIPAATLPGPVTLTFSGAGQLTGRIVAQTVAPGLFAANANGQGVAAATALRYLPTLQNAPVPVFGCGAAAGTCLPVPISLDQGSSVYLTLYGTGIRGRSSLENVHVYMGNALVAASYAGPQGQFAGLDQVNVLLPVALHGSGNVEIQLEVDGRVSNVVQIAVQ